MRILLARVVERAEFCGPKPLDVPEVKELVGDRDERICHIRLRKLLLEDDGRRVEMFHAVAHRQGGIEMKQEGVVGEFRLGERGQLRSDNLASLWSTCGMINKKYVFAGLIGFAAIVGWNVFLIQRDDRMFDAYYHQQAIENLKKPPSIEIR